MERITSKFSIELDLFTPGDISFTEEGYPDMEAYDARFAAWNELPATLSEATFTTDKGPLVITVDWRHVVNCIEAERNELDVFDSRFLGTNTCSESFAFGTITIPHDLIPEGELKYYSGHTRLLKYIQNFLYQVFLALNISSPGCCDFSHSTITVEKTTIPLLVSSDSFEGACSVSEENGDWPLLLYLPLSQTWNWMQGFNIGTKQIAETRIERALFALLHSCTETEVNPSKLIWLAHALETLFDTPHEGISKALRNRIMLVLGTPESHDKKIKQAINSFYELRSQFVHGGLEIPHPLNNEHLDVRVNHLKERLNKNIHFATSIIMAIIQAHVLNNWKAIEFSESFDGVDI